METDSNDAMKIKTEADSNDITEYPCDDGPSMGMFSSFHISLISCPMIPSPRGLARYVEGLASCLWIQIPGLAR